MAENKDQHYVPKMLMKRFADPKHIFSFIYKDKKKSRTVLNVPYDNQCQYDYYYGRDKEWEHLLSEIESKTSPIFDRIIADDNYYPDDEDIKIIKDFFLAQRSRTPRMIEWEKSNVRRSYLEGLRVYLHPEEYVPLSQNEIDYVDSAQNDYFEKTAKDMMRTLCFNSKYISDLECLIVHFNCKTKLVLSDDPVIVANPFIHSAGMVNIGIVMMLPISPSTLVVLRDPVLFEHTRKVIVSSREKAVNSLNRYQAITFDKRLMFSNSSDVDYVLNLIKNTEAERKQFIKTGEGATLPGPNDSMVITHYPTLISNYPYTFSSILKEYRQFKFFDHINYRFESKRYLERLDVGMPIIAQTPMSSIDIKKLPKYKSFMLSYWNLHKKYETVHIDLDNDRAH